MIGALSSDLARQVRSQCREKNTNSITDVDVYDALTRGYKYAMEFVATLFPEPLIETRDIVVSNGTFTLPEDIYSDRILKILDVSDSYPRKVDARGYRYIEELPITGTHPEYYVVTGRDVTLYPPGNGTSLRIYYCRQVERVVRPIGRILNSGTAASIQLDEFDKTVETISGTSGSNLNFFNIVDGQTGHIKGTYEVDSLSIANGSVLSVVSKTTPTVTSVLNRTIDTSTDVISPDDYLCSIYGSCTLRYPEPTENLIIQYAVAEIRRALGQDVGVEESAMKRVEKQLKSSWTGRESTLQIKKENRIWHRRRIY